MIIVMLDRLRDSYKIYSVVSKFAQLIEKDKEHACSMPLYTHNCIPLTSNPTFVSTSKVSCYSNKMFEM